MKFKVLVACVVMAVSASGCKRKKAEVPIPELPAPAQVAPVPGAPANPGAETQAASNSAMAFSNASVMTMMLQEFVSKNGRLPNDVNELSSIKSFGPIPKAPAGYRFVIDQKKKQVVAVQQ